MGSIIIEQNARGRCGITRNSRKSRYNAKTGRAVLIKFTTTACPNASRLRRFAKFNWDHVDIGTRWNARVPRTVNGRLAKFRALDTMHVHSSIQQPEGMLYLENWNSALIQPLENRWSFWVKRWSREHRALRHIVYLVSLLISLCPDYNQQTNEDLQCVGSRKLETCNVRDPRIEHRFSSGAIYVAPRVHEDFVKLSFPFGPFVP